jgi:HAD superfamily phosphoserine phosphatase-like hydrolase
MTKRVFVSSTFKDLAEHRKSVREFIDRLGAKDVAMEAFGSRDERPKAECLRIVREECDIFVGIYARRYGSVPDGDGFSVTEAEYEEAGQAGVPRFIYLLSPSAEWPDAEGEPGKSKLDALKLRLKSAHMTTYFTSKEDLAAKVAADLGRHFADANRRPSAGYGGLYHQPARDWVAQPSANPWRYKVAAFDLDGTLLRGQNFTFSWEAVWGQLGFSKAVQQKLKKEYRQRAKSSADPKVRIAAYRDWCQSACENFRTRRLTREQMRTISAPLTVTKNFETAMAMLRDAGMVTALISGGINCFLEDKIPEFRKWFDFAFINVLRFDDAGLLDGVVATEFDFEGKGDALRLVMERAGCAAAETVFVGDGFNDEDILLAAGQSIAYPPKDQAVKGAAGVHIQDDDLEKVVSYVLVE